MSEEVVLPHLVVKTAYSAFRLRCHAAAWADGYGANVRIRPRHTQDMPGLLLLSIAGPDTAVKALRATLYQADIDATFTLCRDDTCNEIVRARSVFDGKAVGYNAVIAKLAPGVVHMVALAKLPGLMPNLSDDHLWTELSGPSYTTPLLQPWIPWLKRAMTNEGGIVVANGFQASVGVLKTEPVELDELVSRGVKQGHLCMVA